MTRKLFLTAVALFPAAAVSAQDRPFNPYAALDANPWMGNNLWGAAQVIRAQGIAAKDRAIAKSLNEDAKQKAIETKQKEILHTKWKLEYMPYEAEFEKRRQEEAYRMQMIAAAPGDILAGYALNTLRKRMRDQHALLEADSTPLPEALQYGGLAKRINFSDGTGNSSSGLLLLEKVNWRGLLQESAFAADRTAVETLLADARKAAEMGQSTYDIQKKLKFHLAQMESRRLEILHSKSCVEMFPHVDATQQLGQLEQSIKLLSKGNLSETIFLKKNIDAPTIGKLIIVLEQRGWQFAPATEGNEAVYTALYNAMKQAIVKGDFQ
jgi:hypothetical protein